MNRNLCHFNGLDFSSVSVIYIVIAHLFIANEWQHVNASVTSITFINRVFRLSTKWMKKCDEQIVHYTKTRSVGLLMSQPNTTESILNWAMIWLMYEWVREWEKTECDRRKRKKINKKKKPTTHMDSEQVETNLVWRDARTEKRKREVDTPSFHRRCAYPMIVVVFVLFFNIHSIILFSFPYSIKYTNK